MSDHQIRMKKYAYIFYGCAIEADRLQEKEDQRQQRITGDMIEGRRLLNGVPEKFREKTVKTYIPSKETMLAWQAVSSLSRGQSHNVLLLGPVGVGKSHLACAAINTLTELAVECRYVYAPDLLDMLREKLTEPTLHDLVYNELYRIPFLAMDDIGVDRDTAWTVSVYMKLIDNRYRNEKPMLLTTNLSMEELEVAVGQRSMSRICESYEIVQMSGEDWRLR